MDLTLVIVGNRWIERNIDCAPLTPKRTPLRLTVLEFLQGKGAYGSKIQIY